MPRRQHSAVVATLSIPLLLMAAGDAHAQVNCAMRADLAAHPTVRWQDLRAACQADHDAYKAQNPVGLEWFANAGNGFSGVPYVLMKVLPDLAPEIWGPPDDGFARFGLFPEPGRPERPLPRGLGIASTAGRPVDAGGKPTGQIDFAKPGLHVVSLACGSCHTGQAETGGGVTVIDGGANTQFDVRKWRDAFEQTVSVHLADENRIAAAAKRIAEIIDAKPQGYFYPAEYFAKDGFLNYDSPAVEAGQRAAVKANIQPILTGLATSTRVRSAGIELQRHTSYGNWNAPGFGGYSTGQQDGSGDLIAQLLATEAAGSGHWDPETFASTPFEAMPPFATVTDIPSVWSQQARAVGQWDGSVKMAFWRNLAAQLPIVGDPSKVDLQNTGLVANFLYGLPPVPYPFEVDMARAVRGEALFKENCADCHAARNTTVYSHRAIGTDMNRAGVLNGPALALFLKGFAAACHDADFVYETPSGEAVLPCRMKGSDVISDRTQPNDQGYVAGVLDGIWARAPYLHNGSVPTLRHLLVPEERPARFLRGSIEFDYANVGWSWDVSRIGRLGDRAPTLMLFNTGRDGASNVGHDRNVTMVAGDGTPRTLRLDWSGPEHAEEVKDLLEYLKTQ